jgi:hypothetical protein
LQVPRFAADRVSLLSACDLEPHWPRCQSTAANPTSDNVITAHRDSDNKLGNKTQERRILGSRPATPAQNEYLDHVHEKHPGEDFEMRLNASAAGSPCTIAKPRQFNEKKHTKRCPSLPTLAWTASKQVTAHLQIRGPKTGSAERHHSRTPPLRDEGDPENGAVSWT